MAGGYADMAMAGMSIIQGLGMYNTASYTAKIQSRMAEREYQFNMRRANEEKERAKKRREKGIEMLKEKRGNVDNARKELARGRKDLKANYDVAYANMMSDFANTRVGAYDSYRNDKTEINVLAQNLAMNGVDLAESSFLDVGLSIADDTYKMNAESLLNNMAAGRKEFTNGFMKQDRDMILQDEDLVNQYGVILNEYETLNEDSEMYDRSLMHRAMNLGINKAQQRYAIQQQKLATKQQAVSQIISGAASLTGSMMSNKASTEMGDAAASRMPSGNLIGGSQYYQNGGIYGNSSQLNNIGNSINGFAKAWNSRNSR